MSEIETKEALPDNALKDYFDAGNGKNKFSIKCKFCGSKILDKNTAKYVKLQDQSLPLMEQDTRKEGEVQSEPVADFYHVAQMFTFENIGFTHTVANCKYLSCADCDAGPVGYHDLNTQESYVAFSRIVHGEDK